MKSKVTRPRSRAVCVWGLRPMVQFIQRQSSGAPPRRTPPLLFLAQFLASQSSNCPVRTLLTVCLIPHSTLTGGDTAKLRADQRGGRRTGGAMRRRDAEARREARREARVLFTFDMAQVCDKGGRCTAMQRRAARWCVVCGAAVKRSRALQCGSERRSERASPGTQAYCMPRIIQKCANTVRA